MNQHDDGSRSRVVDEFHNLYYSNPYTWPRNTFLGCQIEQCPLDMYLYQEIIARVRPAFILQSGVKYGGSILYFATLLDVIGADPSALAVGIDVLLTESARSLRHPRIRLIEGDSTTPETLRWIKELLPAARGLVSLDSDHRAAHVHKELRIYAEFVSVGSYLVAEDTNINGHPVLSGFGPGPAEAVESFLAEDNRFMRDDDVWRRNLFSFHQGGWLRRVRDRGY
jgi:cephalosporin hydroxylase